MGLELFILALLLGFPAAYITRSLRLTPVSSHEGPFKSKTHVVEFPQHSYIDPNDGFKKTLPAHQQALTLFDWIRRPFGVYKVEGNTWIVQNDSAERWTCLFCLSFWVSSPFTLLIYLNGSDLLWLPVCHFGIATVSTLVSTLIDRLMGGD